MWRRRNATKKKRTRRIRWGARRVTNRKWAHEEKGWENGFLSSYAVLFHSNQTGWNVWMYKCATITWIDFRLCATYAGYTIPSTLHTNGFSVITFTFHYMCACNFVCFECASWVANGSFALAKRGHGQCIEVFYPLYTIRCALYTQTLQYKLHCVALCCIVLPRSGKKIYEPQLKANKIVLSTLSKAFLRSL